MTDDIKARVVNKAIEDKVDKLHKETYSILAHSDGHKDLARRIVDCMRNSIIAYYNRYPDRALDERGRDNEEWNIWRVKEILLLLDDYNISIKIQSPEL